MNPEDEGSTLGALGLTASPRAGQGSGDPVAAQGVGTGTSLRGHIYGSTSKPTAARAACKHPVRRRLGGMAKVLDASCTLPSPRAVQAPCGICLQLLGSRARPEAGLGTFGSETLSSQRGPGSWHTVWRLQPLLGRGCVGGTPTAAPGPVPAHGPRVVWLAEVQTGTGGACVFCRAVTRSGLTFSDAWQM